VLAPLAILPLTALAVVTKPGQGSLYHPDFPFTTIYNPGAHGFSEVFYAYTSAFANNGQNFAGLGANNPFYNSTLALAMMLGRFGLAIPALALAGLFVQQKCKPFSLGTMPTDTLLFGGLTIGVVLIVGALNYIPALTLGPIIEHISLR
jgi:K+-transporting ATPase ATPase A chain